jgi:endonuclease/exonuclease/phosphatase family metal-dependent hydrolase
MKMTAFDRSLRRRDTRWVPLVLALAAASCATASNYLEPDRPRYTGSDGVISDRDPALRIVTFNVAHAREIERAAQCLGEAPLRGADVVLLQEMDGPGADAIAHALHMSFVDYPSSVRPGEKEMGTAVLSQWPIVSSRKLILPHRGRVVHRGRNATVATVHIEGIDVRVYSLHLGAPLGMSGHQRGDEAEAVIADARGWDGPVIVGGDFNSHAVGKRFEKAGYRWVTKSVGHTVGPFSFDHVFVRGLAAATGAGVDRTCRKASDHFPVWARLGAVGPTP